MNAPTILALVGLAAFFAFVVRAYVRQRRTGRIDVAVGDRHPAGSVANGTAVVTAGMDLAIDRIDRIDVAAECRRIHSRGPDLPGDEDVIRRFDRRVHGPARLAAGDTLEIPFAIGLPDDAPGLVERGAVRQAGDPVWAIRVTATLADRRTLSGGRTIEIERR